MPHYSVTLKTASTTTELVKVRGRALDFAQHRLQYWLSIALSIILFAPVAVATEKIGEPTYTSQDWFEYEGYTEQLILQLTQEWDDDDDFEGVTLTTREELRITQLGTESCTILTWSGDCVKAQITHLVNFTLDWQDNTTNYDNDTLNMSVSYTATHWKSRGTAGWEKLDSTTMTTTQFSGGGEDNFLEHELQEVALITRSGEFPETIQIGESWDVEKNVKISGLERVRENRGLWTDTEYNLTTVSQIAYQVLGERVVHYGIANEKLHDTLAVQRVDLGDNTTTIDFFREEGFLAHTETWQNGTLSLSATLTAYRYYIDEPHASTVSANSVMPILLTCLAVLVVLGAGAAWYGLSTVPKVKPIIPLLPPIKVKGLIEQTETNNNDKENDGETLDSLDELDL